MTGDDPRDEPAAAAPTPFDSVVGRVEAQLARGLPSGAVESPPPAVPIAAAHARIYGAGIALGVAALALVANQWVTHLLGRRSPWGRPMGDLDAFVSAPSWRWVSLAGAVALCAGAYSLARRDQRWATYVAAVVCVAMLVMSAYGLEQRLEPPGGDGWSLYVPASLED